MSYGVPAGEPAHDVPVCPRHPDRVSYIRCQRCGRPACPECQHSAPVGIQCADCFQESRAGTPAYRTSYGGAVRSGKPVVTITLMALCAAAYVLQWIAPGFTELFWFAPVYTDIEPWRLLTAAFLHSPGFIFHIAFNLYALWLLGRSLEPLLGRLRFTLLYLISALGGSVGVVLLAPAFQAVVGASGAIFGLFGALFVIQRQRGGEVKALLILIGINLVLGFVYPNISWQAHLGGILTGAACGAVLAYAPKGPRRALVQFGGLGVIALILTAVALLWTPNF
ncbi:rhomboid family intramembrane serine protease [Arthrobacter caoxuetaonis]|uniref:Rhomboid family intramembrane serine protease n=2 Tax=Arthrobacter caoxuetaonis TaxID=2886935 RepID=A0A9X1MEI5_9MICC|nr:rhomboid family intramembrane serine protease [Arthrobacter caoxuetaonis]MCC3281762.1 rhomboid family intramembrane serine protease [Arthrobacter caoxuetaonis]MCC3298568.1 rhomboid family intramembrane serine protease [Arthrobacter caoxuetaonis]USQ57312.1 rhomboid family intramembrane serine protease [Arthrobacter caoxuetaonis]